MMIIRRSPDEKDGEGAISRMVIITLGAHQESIRMERV